MHQQSITPKLVRPPKAPFRCVRRPYKYEWSQNMTNLQKLESEYQQKLIPYTMSGHESLSGLPDPIFSETLTAESLAKVKAIQTEYDRKRAAIMAEGEARLADEHNRTQKQDCP